VDPPEAVMDYCVKIRIDGRTFGRYVPAGVPLAIV
jgi:hypothetical protein